MSEPYKDGYMECVAQLSAMRAEVEQLRTVVQAARELRQAGILSLVHVHALWAALDALQ